MEHFIGWAVILFISYAIIAPKPKRKRTSKSRNSRPRKPDNSDLYWVMHQRSEKMRNSLEDYAYKYSEDESKWDRIIQKFDAWLKQEEEKAKIRCIENDGESMYTPSETLFQILASQGRLNEGENFTKRLAKLKHHNARQKWNAAVRNNT